MVGVFDAYTLADFYNLIIGVQQQLLCFVDADFVEVLHGGVLIILCKFAAQAVFVDFVLGCELVEGVRFEVCVLEAAVHVRNIGGNMIRACLLDGAHQIELCEKRHKVTGAHHAVHLVVGVISQHLFPCCQHIRIVVKFKNKITHAAYFLQMVLEHGSADKTDGVFPDIVLADQLMVFAAVHDGERAFCEVVARIDSICVLAEEPASAAGRVHEAQGVEICRLVGEG